MDINSNPEADQVAQDVELVLWQAQEKVRLVAEAGETSRGWKRQGERKARNRCGHEIGSRTGCELVVDREWRILLQVILGYLSAFKTGSWLQIRKTWRHRSWCQNCLLAPFYRKGKRWVPDIFWIDPGLENWTGRAVPGPMGTGFWPVASGTIPTASGARGHPSEELWSVCSKKIVCTVTGVWVPSEMTGWGRSRGVTASKEKPGGGRFWCRVWVEWVGWKKRQGLETGSLLRLGGVQELLREQMGSWKRIGLESDGGLGASDEDEVLTMRD